MLTGHRLRLSGNIGKNSFIGFLVQLCLANLIGEKIAPSGIYHKLVNNRPARSEDRKGQVNANNSTVLIGRSTIGSFLSDRGIVSSHVITVCTFQVPEY